jgi:hypothetical protein
MNRKHEQVADRIMEELGIKKPPAPPRDLRALWLSIMLMAMCLGALVFFLTACGAAGPKWAADSSRATLVQNGWAVDVTFDQSGNPVRGVILAPPGVSLDGVSVDIDKTADGRSALLLERVQ